MNSPPPSPPRGCGGAESSRPSISDVRVAAVCGSHPETLILPTNIQYTPGMGTTTGTDTGTIDRPLELLIVGAGLSGIDMAHHVAANFPDWDWEIHDAHSDLGGTWHTFRYPGIRSDSDMATFAFPFKPWPHKGTLGRGEDIKEYIRDAARECGALERLHTDSWIKNSDWRTDLNLYAVTAVSGGSAGDPADARPASDAAHAAPGAPPERTIYARRVHYASGYYSHGHGHRPHFPGEEDFAGEIIHPQAWPEDLDVAGKRIVVIGSGATAITLVPALEAAGAQVTMLQRSPSYVAPLPEVDLISGFWNRILPRTPASRAARFHHAVRDMGQYVIAQHLPFVFKTALKLMQRPFLSRREIDEHFTPRYRPWDQRVCKAPGGDFFRALNGNARVVTDTIDTFTPAGIRTSSGEELAADLIVTATGLDLEAFGGGTLSIDGEELHLPDQVFYRGIMLAGLPNFSFTVGYVNASWTLRSDMVSRYMVRLWRTGEEFYAPVLPPGRHDRPLLDFDAGYIRRAIGDFPAQGDRSPWRYTQNYLVELPDLARGDQREDMAFGKRCLELVGRAAPGPKVRSISSEGRFVAADLSALPPAEFVIADGRSVRVRRGGPATSGGAGTSGAAGDAGAAPVAGASRAGADTGADAGTTGDLPPLVFIHGIGRSLEDWDDQATLLAGRRRFIAVDIPGFGLSDPAERVTVPDTAALIWRVLEELGEVDAPDAHAAGHSPAAAGDRPRRVCLVGNSLGGALSMEMTTQHPDRVAAVCLVDSAGFGDRATDLLRLVALPLVGETNAKLTRHRVLYEPIEHLILRRPGSVTRHRLGVQRTIGRHPARARTYRNFVRELGSVRGISKDWCHDLVDRFRRAAAGVPVQFVWGDADKILPYAQFRAGLEELSDVVMDAAVFDGGGHMPQLEFPAEFAENLLGFLDRAESGAVAPRGAGKI